MDPRLFNLLNGLGLTLLVLLECRASTFRGVLRDGPRMRRNLAYLTASLLTGLLLHQSAQALAPVLPKLSFSAPLWLQLVGVFLMGELFNWVLHWAKHNNAFLWRLHCQHHRDDKFTVWLVVHTYGPEVLLSGVLMSALILMAGFSRLALDCYLLFYSIVNVYQHSAHPYSLGLLDKLVVNPAYHRQHHGGEQANYGSTLTVWDWVFRTLIWPHSRFDDRNPPPVEHSKEPFGFWAEMLYPLRPSRWVATKPPPSLRMQVSDAGPRAEGR